MPVSGVSFKQTTRAVLMEGTAKPGALIKVENLSAAPMSAEWTDATFRHTHADAKGHFHVAIPAALEGDEVRVSADDESWQVMNVKAGGADTRRAEFNPQGLRLVEVAPGVYGADTVSIDQRVSEPGTLVAMFNMRTGQQFRFPLDEQGQFPAAFAVPGQPGDVLAMSCTDGTNNAGFQVPAGFLVVPQPPRKPGDPIVEPGLLPGDTSTLKPAAGPLFVGQPKAADAIQGEDLGDCYLVATLASLAEARPEKIKELIKDNGDGTFTVTFKRYDRNQLAYVDELVTVTNLLPVNEAGELPYAHGTEKKPGTMALWFPILEKAYAEWKGGYTGIINGFPYEVYEALLGKEGTHFDVRSAPREELFKSLRHAVNNHQPLVAWTNVDSGELPFNGTGLTPDHAYSVFAVAEKNGQRTVTMRNSFGHSQPAGGPEDHGYTTLTWEQFLKYFVGAGTVAF